MGVDAGSGYIHTTVVTVANVADSAVATDLIREDDEVLYGYSAYCAVGKHENVQADPHLSQMDYRTNRQKPYRKYAWDEGPGTYWLRKLEYQKSRVRSKDEYVFHVIKGIFGFRKTRYKGLAKLKNHLDILCASANFFMLATARKAERIQNSQTACSTIRNFRGVILPFTGKYPLKYGDFRGISPALTSFSLAFSLDYHPCFELISSYLALKAIPEVTRDQNVLVTSDHI